MSAKFLGDIIILRFLVFQIFDACDVDDGAAGEVFSEAVGIDISSNFDRIFPNERHVVVGNIERLSVRHPDAKRFERLTIHQFFQLQCGEHIF